MPRNSMLAWSTQEIFRISPNKTNRKAATYYSYTYQDQNASYYVLGNMENICTYKITFKMSYFSWRQWQTTLISALKKQRWENLLGVQGRLGLQSKFQGSQGYTEKSCLNNKINKQEKEICLSVPELLGLKAFATMHCCVKLSKVLFSLYVYIALSL